MTRKQAKRQAQGRSVSAPKRQARGAKRASQSVSSPADQGSDRLNDLLSVNRQLKRKIFDLYTVFEISRNFNAVRDYHSLLDSFIFTCLGQLGAQRGAIFLSREGRGDAFHLAEAKGAEPLPDEGHRFAVDTQLLEYLRRLNRPVLTDELKGDQVTAQEKSILKLFPSGIIVPLIYQARLSGIFIISEKMSGGEFLPADMEFLSVLSNQIAVAIENARLYEAERMATRQLQAAQQQLLQTERLAALGEMSASVAHEVNNPLGIIKNYLTLICQHAEEDSSTDEYAHVIGQEIDRIAQIVKQLLEFHRPQPRQFVRLNLHDVLEEVLNFMQRPLKSQKITIEREFGEKQPMVQGNLDSLRQVFLNLLINARDAMKEGGTLTVRTSIENDKVSLQMDDTGPGIPSELIPRIFEPFFTTKKAGEGTGLGLSVCYGIIKRHDGSIVYSNIENGGRFVIVLPLAKDKKRDAGKS